MDLIAADSYWLNTLTFALTMDSLAPFIGGSLNSKTIFPCTIVHTHKFIDQGLHFAIGFQLDEAQAALNAIAKVGPGGTFLAAQSTLKNIKKGYYTSPINPRWSMEKCLAEGQPTARVDARKDTGNDPYADNPGRLH